LGAPAAEDEMHRSSRADGSLELAAVTPELPAVFRPSKVCAQFAGEK
jgi:hypothetical protein